ncbi:MAG: 4Fe-4S dicluster domain-containing protein [Deltaproteobacteria bacterium]|nr:4Fe-4S dicluster domain-containing protein [Deltaproteobacteria bacterium]MBW2228027.1 4Fe-4S dicluster domain-containing protein [Deltaproteobacteria bacterium]MBW2326230.1 4Fe-4S dicluster domain-containing protein [Deltaproteobacteria bacterium]
MKTAKINVKNGDLLETLQEFFRSILRLDNISAILVPQHLPMKNVVMPTLVTDPEHLDGTDPLAPAFPMNSAKIVSRLTRKPMGGKLVAVLRPCEIRAFVELVKLKQGRMEEVVLVGIDCLGSYRNADYAQIVGEEKTEFTSRFYRNALSGKESAVENFDLFPACKACEFPIPNGADILIGLFGVDTNENLLVQARTPKGEGLYKDLDLSDAEEPPERHAVVESLITKHTAYRDGMFAETTEATNSLEKLGTYLADCVNCYNCRVACPVCYCKECVFVTDVFDHEPDQYLRWANRRGVIKMPTDTVFYHITRLAHISTSCVGCGQCTNACPNDIPVMELFRTVSYRTQKAFEYEAGRNIEDDLPLSVFREDELAEVVGIGKAV